jgi:hypothetical protein
LNPRLVGTSYHHDVKIFITSCILPSI